MCVIDLCQFYWNTEYQSYRHIVDITLQVKYQGLISLCTDML